MSDVDVVEIPPCPTFRLAVERARLHLRVARLHEAGISRRRSHQIEMAEKWLDQAIEELRDEDFFGRSAESDAIRVCLSAGSDQHGG